MTAEEWAACTDPQSMLRNLDHSRACGPRKMRLFASACLRILGGTLGDARWLRVAELIESFADGEAALDELRHERAEFTTQLLATHEGLLALAFAAWDPGIAHHDTPAKFFGAMTASQVAAEVWDAERRELSWFQHALFRNRHWERVVSREKKRQAALLRDILGNPLKPRPAIDPAWLRWGDGTVPRLTRAIYDQRRWEDMGVLHDALLDAGCDNEDMLSHANERGALHCRGCWLIDLLLQKE